MFWCAVGFCIRPHFFWGLVLQCVAKNNVVILEPTSLQVLFLVFGAAVSFTVDEAGIGLE